MHAANQTAAACWDLIRRIKDSLDPNHILAPGRYCSMDSPDQAPGLQARGVPPERSDIKT